MSEWFVTDDSSYQCCRMRPDVGEGCYEFIEIIKPIDGGVYWISNRIINPKDYSVFDVCSVLNTYGYKDIQHFIDWHSGKFYWQLVAEMFFESVYGSDECYDNCEETVAKLREVTGLLF